MVKSTRKTRRKQSRHSLERVPTGILHFDNLIEGGFEKNSTTVLVGGPGSGKSIFATQFLVEGMKRGERCLYVTFEEKKEQFYANMLEFGWNLKSYEEEGLFIFLEYTPLKVKNMLEEGGGSIENIIISKKISRLIVDSMTSFVLLFEDELARREAALSLFNMIRKWNCTSLLTLEEEHFFGDKSSTKALEFESDAIVLLYFVRIKKERERFLEVLKMRGTKHSGKVYPFNIRNDGIMVSQKPSSHLPFDAA